MTWHRFSLFSCIDGYAPMKPRVLVRPSLRAAAGRRSSSILRARRSCSRTVGDTRGARLGLGKGRVRHEGVISESRGNAFSNA